MEFALKINKPDAGKVIVNYFVKDPQEAASVDITKDQSQVTQWLRGFALNFPMKERMDRSLRLLEYRKKQQKQQGKQSESPKLV